MIFPQIHGTETCKTFFVDVSCVKVVVLVTLQEKCGADPGKWHYLWEYFVLIINSSSCFMGHNHDHQQLPESFTLSMPRVTGDQNLGFLKITEHEYWHLFATIGFKMKRNISTRSAEATSKRNSRFTECFPSHW